MRNKLLSIGEVSKMKHVGIKSLRYYESIGILTPAYINPTSGYRYYSMNQMIDIDIITTCIELGIPLKSLTEYINPNGSLDFYALLKHGHTLAIERIHQSQAALARISSAMDEIEAQVQLQNATQPYVRTIKSHTALYTPYKLDEFRGPAYVQAITDLYTQAQHCGIVPLYVQGMIHRPSTVHENWGVYVEVYIPDYCDIHVGSTPHVLADDFILMRIPEGQYSGWQVRTSSFTCQPEYCPGWQVRTSSFETCFERIFEKTAHHDGLLITSEIWNEELLTTDYVVEVLAQ